MTCKKPECRTVCYCDLPTFTPSWSHPGFRLSDQRCDMERLRRTSTLMSPGCRRVPPKPTLDQLEDPSSNVYFGRHLADMEAE